MTDGLNPNHRDAIIEKLSANPKVERIVLFGSRAMGAFTTTSDIDLALFGSALTLSDQAALSEAMAELSIPQRVDILIHHRIESQALREHIRKYGVEWFARTRAAGAVNMAGEWRERPLEEMCAFLNRGTAPSYVDLEGLMVLNQKCVRDGRVLLDQARRTDPTVKRISKERVLKPFDVLVNSTGVGTLGRVAQVLTLPEAATVDSHITIIRADPQKVFPRYIGYALRKYQPEIEALAEGSTGQTELSRARLAKLRIALPPPIEQRAIACILGTLDDKIELNRRMSQTLEEMARAIFKSWFVDFDPVRAKAAVRREHPDWTNAQVSRAACPNLKPEIAELFPDRLVDSELGEIPEGWEVGTLGDVAQHPRRGVQPNRVAPDTPYIALEHMPRRCIALSDWGTAEGIESNKFEFRKGEVLFGKLRPYFHKVGVAPVDGVCSTDIVVVCSRTPHWFAFVLGVVSSDDFVEYTNAGSTGTKMPRTSWTEMARYEIVLPPEALAQAFTGRVQPQVDRIIAAIHESRTLAALRDAFLPKLISGELRVPDAERIVGRCI